MCVGSLVGWSLEDMGGVDDNVLNGCGWYTTALTLDSVFRVND